LAGPSKPAAKKQAGAVKKSPDKKAKPASSMYEVSGSSIKRKNKTCPRCGDGSFMANHKDRSSCGKCRYMERK
jgi:ubiquitin-small subunit ribosomal protein S27Ae